MNRRAVRASATLVVTGLCIAYIVWKIDLGQTLHVLAQASPGWWLASLAIMVVSVWPMAWRWQRLLAARGVHDSLRWLVRSYFVGYAAGQILPTSLGGDASRIYETSRRHEGRKRRSCGHRAARARARRHGDARARRRRLRARRRPLRRRRLSLGRARVRRRGGVCRSCSSSRPGCTGCCSVCVPLLRWLRIERPLREVYIAVHSFRSTPRLLVSMFALTLVVQAVRVLAIWCAGKAVGVDLSPRPYYVMGPLLFLVDARAVHGERVRRARVVLRLVSRRARRIGRPCVRERASSSSSSRSRSRCRERGSSPGRRCAVERAHRPR